MSSADSRPSSVDGILTDYLRALEAGESVDRSIFLAQHPGMEEEVSAFFDAVELIHRRAEPALDEGEAIREAHELAMDELSGERHHLPRRFGDYELLERVGSGGMGIVYRARHVSDDRIVAVKVLKSGSFASQNEVRRFYDEARAAGGLVHPNIVHVHEVGDVDGQHYLSMDFVEGQDLAEVYKHETLEAEEAARILHLVAEAIEFAHGRGIVHRDLKPANILIDADGVPHVTDFGLAKHLDSGSGVTSTGALVGTPSYMSPEAAKAQRVGKAADVYSLGAVLYAVHSGRPPFQGPSTMQTVLDVIHRQAEPPTLHAPRFAPELEKVAMKCLEKEPAARYGSARDLAEDLGRFLHGRAVRARSMGPLRRGSRWVAGIPVVEALTGRSSSRPSAWQRRSQWLLLGAAVAVALWALFGWFGRAPRTRPMPGEVFLAAAVQGGEYYELCERLAQSLEPHVARPVHVLETQGSLDNRERLLAGEANLALLQTSAIHPGEVSVVAPLYDDLVHVIVRARSGLESVGELASRRVSIGLRGSGMQASAVRLLAHFDLTPEDLVEPFVHFTTLAEDDAYVAAVVTTGPRNEDLRALLASGDFRLLALADGDRERLTGPIFHQRTLARGVYGATESGTPLPAADVPTLATTTFLAAETNAADELVTQALEALYGESERVSSLGLMPLATAAEWGLLDLHPAARRFYDAAGQPAER